MFLRIIAVLTGTGGRASSLFRRKRRGKELDAGSTAIPGGVAAGNISVHQFIW